jgi:DNA-binding transcriptional ArsR family regulator
LPPGQLIVHLTYKHRSRLPREIGPDIHIWITPRQRDFFAWIAESIDRGEPMSYQELAAKGDVTVATIQHHVKRLKELGLICTFVTRRSIRLTDSGKLVWDQIKAKRSKANGCNEGG